MKWNKAQAITEVVLTSTMIIGAVVIMSIYVQRSIKARIDAQNNEMMMSQGQLQPPVGYEPYYRHKTTETATDVTTTVGYDREKHTTDLETIAIIGGGTTSTETTALDADEY